MRPPAGSTRVRASSVGNVTESSSPTRRARGPGRPVEPYRLIGPVSLHSKPLTDGTYVTSHEQTWGSTRLRDVPPVPATPPSRPPQASPASLAPLPDLPAVSATATACQGRGRDGRVPFLGRQLQAAPNPRDPSPSGAGPRPPRHRTPCVRCRGIDHLGLVARAYGAFSRVSSVGAITANIAPCGSISIASRPTLMSIGPFSSWPPAAFVVSAAASASGTVK